MLIAHLPETAVLWVEEKATRSTGRTRAISALRCYSPAENTNTRCAVAWIENGRWVSQTRSIAVRAGLMQAIYLQPTEEKDKSQ